MAYRLLLLGLLATSAARQIPMDAWTAEETINAQTLPTIYGLLLMLVLFFTLFRSPPVASESAIPAGRYLRLAGTGLIVLGFIALIGWLNLWLALGTLLFTSAWWLGERRWLPMMSLASSIPLFGYLAIEVALNVYLPD
jgi:hypothetical protein